jgi:hypothetical protein
VKRLAVSLSALLIALLCAACEAIPGGSLDAYPPGQNYGPALDEPTEDDLQPSHDPTKIAQQRQKALAFGKSYTWHDGVKLTIGKPQKLIPSEFAVVDKSKHYLKFTVTVANKSDKPVGLGMVYISVLSGNEVAEDVFDSPSGLNGPPDIKVRKGQTSEFDVGFGVADPKDLLMEVALHDKFERSVVFYST